MLNFNQVARIGNIEQYESDFMIHGFKEENYDICSLELFGEDLRQASAVVRIGSDYQKNKGGIHLPAFGAQIILQRLGVIWIRYLNNIEDKSGYCLLRNFSIMCKKPITSQHQIVVGGKIDRVVQRRNRSFYQITYSIEDGAFFGEFNVLFLNQNHLWF